MIEKYNDDVLTKPYAVIDFYAEWCGPCKTLAPALDKLAAQYEGGITFAKVNVEELEDVAEQFAVVNLPTLVFMRDGEEVVRHSGAWNAQGIEEVIKEWFPEVKA